MGKITSKIIAEQAGVSVSTVSLVLNNKPGVGKKTRDKILRILMDNDIHPKNSESEILEDAICFCKIIKHGHILNDRHNIFISEYIDGVVREAKNRNIRVEMLTYENAVVSEVLIDLKRKNHFIGYIFLATELSIDEIHFLNSLEVPHVFLDANYPFEEGRFVTMDNSYMVYQAIEYLHRMGHTSIGMITARGCSNFQCREVAFRQAIHSLGLTLSEENVFSVHSSLTVAYDELRKEFSKKKKTSLPSALFACNDLLAIGALHALHELNIRVPEDISLVGFDDLPTSSLIQPSLTTMSVPKVSIGRLAVNLLFDQNMEGDQYESQKYLLGGKLVERNSVKKLKD
ncbi:MAG: LacI family DNA-binding transcriptional regulator [Clostridia bacterium]|nr:LacI family DNA-binding transcriptional regulator [Clostridia bacterium]